jgi:hypothetical protein
MSMPSACDKVDCKMSTCTMLIVMIYIRGEGIIQDANAFGIYEHRHEVSEADCEYKQVYRLL